MNEKASSKKYPEQSEYVKGNKIWLELPSGQTVIISSQARKVLQFYNVNEQLFIQKLKELLLDCFTNLKQEKGYTHSFERLSVSKATFPLDNNEESETPHINIEIYDCFGTKTKKDIQHEDDSVSC